MSDLTGRDLAPAEAASPVLRMPYGTPAQQGVRGAAKHLTTYLPFYALFAVFLFLLTLFPPLDHQLRSHNTTNSVAATGGSGTSGSGVSGGDATVAGSTDVGGAAATAGGATATAGGATSAAAGGTTGGGTKQGAAATGAPASGGAQGVGTVEVGTGTTRGGFACAPGVNQIPYLEYAAPCVNKFSGGNGGATSRGITADKVLLVRRKFPCSANCQAVQQFAQQAGAADPAVTEAVRKVFLDYFNTTFETYGRTVVIQDFEGNGDSTAEAEGQGKPTACAEADQIANEIKAFGETGTGGSAPFSECAADQKLMEFAGGAYYDEAWYKKLDPYVWNGTMECERISHQLAEYIGKRLANKKAKWAGDQITQNTTRKFGTYVPTNDSYQRCTDAAQADLKNTYHTDPGERYNYVLDVSRFPDQASQAIVQFHAAGVTTIVLACDPISPVFLTQEAKGQGYFPEWFNIGVALNDFDTIPRLWDSQEVTGHLFGMSQLGPSQALAGPSSEPGILYKHITGKDIPPGTAGDYFGLVGIFNFIQQAGPVLTPQNMAAGIRGMPPRGAPVAGGTVPYAVGWVSWQDGPDGTAGKTDHTGVDDSRETYWDANGTSPYDGKQGTFIATYGGKRFRNGEWPAEEPPVYPTK